MNILIVGNGFDLAHGLPTRYTDFLEFVKRIKVITSMKKKSSYDRFKREYLDGWAINKEVISYVSKIVKGRIDKERIDELADLVKENFWLDYFILSETYIEQGWIDFEKEISRKIQNIDKNWKNRIEMEGVIESKSINVKDYKVFLEYLTKLQTDFWVNEKDKEYIRNKLLYDLNKMIRCLEIYLSDCVERIPFESMLEDIRKIKVDKILSFNYTDTYRNLYASYDEKTEYDFIHGKANLLHSVETNNMVLGIDEYLTDESASRELDFIAFKKYFQRIHKETGCGYKDWVEQIKEESEKIHNVYILGHSLDLTDGDVLREIILNENVKTTIFYYDRKTYGVQIKNLVQVISRDELIKKVYGKNRSIIFREQKEPLIIQRQSNELKKDLLYLQNIHLLTNKGIRDLVDKIQNRIKGKNLFYISNVNDLIILYSEILDSKLFENLERYFIEIAKELVNKSHSNIFDTKCKHICRFYDDRVESMWQIILNLHNGVRKEYTKEAFEKIVSKKNIRELVEFCEYYRITEKEQLEKVLNVIMNKFYAANVNVNLTFERLFKIFEATEKDIVISVLEEQINYENDIIKKARLEFLYKSVIGK